MTRRTLTGVTGLLGLVLSLAVVNPVSAQSDYSIQSFTCLPPNQATTCFRVHGNTTTAAINLTLTGGNIIASGGYKSVLVFAHPNYAVTGGHTNEVTPIAGVGDERISGAGVNPHRIPYAGSVIGISLAASTALTGTASAHAEALIFTSATASRATGLTTVIGATLTNTQFSAATQGRGVDNFASTEGVGCRTSTNAAFTPGTVNLVCSVIIEY